MMSIQNLVLFYQLVLKKDQILTSNKGRNSVANLRITKIYITNVDLVNDNVYTKFGLNLFIRSQDIEKKQIHKCSRAGNSAVHGPIWSNY